MLILDSYQADSCLDRWNTYLTNKKWDTPLKKWSLWQNSQFEFEQVEKEGWKLFHINDIGTYSLSNTRWVWWYLTSWTWKPLKPPKLLLYFLIIRNPRNWGPHLHTRHRDCKRVPWIEHCWRRLGWGKNHFFHLGFYDWPAWKRITPTLDFYPLAPMSDQDIISPYHVNTVSTIQMMRIQRNINFGIFSWSNTKFSELTI